MTKFKDLFESKYKKVSYKELIKEFPEATDVYNSTDKLEYFINTKDEIYIDYNTKTRLYNAWYQNGRIQDIDINKFHNQVMKEFN